MTDAFKITPLAASETFTELAFTLHDYSTVALSCYRNDKVITPHYLDQQN